MPIYEYRCRNGHRFEVFQSMSEDPVSRCPECAAPVERVFHPVAVHFKGSGFYSTDYAPPGSSDGKGPGEGKKESGKQKSDSEGSAKKNSGEKAKAGSGGE
jgi:putative FmdB family regulatory protein